LGGVRESKEFGALMKEADAQVKRARAGMQSL
jgi:hypothetical protein